jgi:hypothetical protein
MKKLKFNILSLVFVLFVVSCNDEIQRTLTDEYVGLDASNTSLLFLRKGDNQPVDIGIPVKLIAQAKSNPVNFTFTIVGSSTAIEGLHYSSDGTTGTIPANAYTATLPIKVLPDNLEPGEIVTLDIALTDADVKLANTDTITYDFQVTCLSDIGGTYSSVASGGLGDGSGGQASAYADLATIVTLTDMGDGVYQVDDMSFGLYSIGYGDTSPPGRIVDICGNISDLGDVDQYSDPFTITGSIGPGGVITLTWSNTWGDLGNVTLTPQ